MGLDASLDGVKYGAHFLSGIPVPANCFKSVLCNNGTICIRKLLSQCNTGISFSDMVENKEMPKQSVNNNVKF